MEGREKTVTGMRDEGGNRDGNGEEGGGERQLTAREPTKWYQR